MNMRFCRYITAALGVCTFSAAYTGVSLQTGEVVGEILRNVEKIRAVRPDAVPMAFWDFDGTIIRGDLSVGLMEDGHEVYRGLIHETIAAGLCGVYRGEDGWKQYWERDYPRMKALGLWLAWPYNAQMYLGQDVAVLDGFCRERIREVYSKWYFRDSVAIWKALAAAGVENYVISASPELFVRNAASSLGVPESRMRAIRVAIDGGRVTTRVIYPVPMGEGKVDELRQLLLARPNGVAVAGFGNSYSTDGAFLRYVVTQRLPGGAKGTALMINGGEPGPGYEGLFMRTEMRDVIGAVPAAIAE